MASSRQKVCVSSDFTHSGFPVLQSFKRFQPSVRTVPQYQLANGTFETPPTCRDLTRSIPYQVLDDDNPSCFTPLSSPSMEMLPAHLRICVYSDQTLSTSHIYCCTQRLIRAAADPQGAFIWLGRFETVRPEYLDDSPFDTLKWTP